MKNYFSQTTKQAIDIWFYFSIPYQRKWVEMETASKTNSKTTQAKVKDFLFGRNVTARDSKVKNKDSLEQLVFLFRTAKPSVSGDAISDMQDFAQSFPNFSICNAKYVRCMKKKLK